MHGPNKSRVRGFYCWDRSGRGDVLVGRVVEMDGHGPQRPAHACTCALVPDCQGLARPAPLPPPPGPPHPSLLPLLCLCAAPYQPQASGGQNSYLPTTTFANCQGQLALVRCLGADAPGSLCAYNGYDVPITGRALDACSSSALPQQARGAAGLLAAAAAAAAWLLLT